MKQKGFTLVEMLVAIGIFAVFMGVMITSYISLVKGFRGTEDYRILYADARYVFDTIIENARNSSVYGCAGSGVNLTIQRSSLSFCSTDGVKKVTFELETGETGCAKGEEIANGSGSGCLPVGDIFMTVEEIDNPLLGFGYLPPKKIKLNSDKVNVREFSFKVFPATNPFELGREFYQPVVIVDAVFERESVSGTTYTLPLHTAISLRTYK